MGHSWDNADVTSFFRLLVFYYGVCAAGVYHYEPPFMLINVHKNLVGDILG